MINYKEQILLIQCPFCGGEIEVDAFCCHIWTEAVDNNAAPTEADCPACLKSTTLFCPFCTFTLEHPPPYDHPEIERELYDHIRQCAGYAAAMLVGDVTKSPLFWRE